MDARAKSLHTIKTAAPSNTPSSVYDSPLYVNTKLECDNASLLNSCRQIGKAEPTLPATGLWDYLSGQGAGEAGVQMLAS